MRPQVTLDYTGQEGEEDRRQTDEIRVLFTNTAGYFGPPMQVHYHIMKHLLPPAYRLYMATNKDEVTAARFRQLDHVKTSQYDLGTTRPMDVSSLGRIIQILLHVPAIFSVIRLIFFIRKQRIDIIHATSEPRAAILAVILSTLCRTKLVIFAHSWNLDRSFPRNFGVAWVMGRADAVVSPSRYIRNRLVSRGVKSSKAWVTSLVTDLDEFNPEIDGTPVRQEYSIDPHTLLIVAVGRINEENPLVFANLNDGTYFHFIDNMEPDIGHLDGLLATRDSLFLADISPRGGFGSRNANTGRIYQIQSVVPEPSSWLTSLSGILVILIAAYEVGRKAGRSVQETSSMLPLFGGRH